MGSMVNTFQPEKFDTAARISDVQQLTSDIVLTRFECIDIAEKVRPGQFVMVKVTQDNDPYLRRPFSVLEANVTDGLIDILYRIVGKGTKLLAQQPIGTCLRVFGPLGQPFDLTGDYTEALLIGGGMGIPPLVMAVEPLLALQKNVSFYYGARHAGEIFFEHILDKPEIRWIKATDDGSAGYHGFITDAFREDHVQSESFKSYRLFSCGPPGMLKNVVSLAKEMQIDTQVSVETLMACGAGICVGCVVPVKNTDTGELEFRLACKDGPVFSADIIDLEANVRSLV